jgi:hypothetical protein
MIPEVSDLNQQCFPRQSCGLRPSRWRYTTSLHMSIMVLEDNLTRLTSFPSEANQVGVNHFSNAVVCVLLLAVCAPLSSGLVRVRDRARGISTIRKGWIVSRPTNRCLKGCAHFLVMNVSQFAVFSLLCPCPVRHIRSN